MNLVLLAQYISASWLEPKIRILRIIIILLNKNMHCDTLSESSRWDSFNEGYDAHFYTYIWKIIPTLSLLPPLIGALTSQSTGIILKPTLIWSSEGTTVDPRYLDIGYLE